MRRFSSMPLAGHRDGGRPHELFEPDAVLPEQYACLRGMPAAGERALLLAVLEMALRDLQLWSGKKAHLLEPPGTHTPECPYAPRRTGANSKHQRAVRERNGLIAWFRSDSTAHAFTFVSICEAFALSPDAIRRQLARCGWMPVRTPTHLHATAQAPRQLHGGYQAAR
jgi:hypothetical protein